jgi:aspartyl-tRNA(Asn)/glutamyl-tRNA(Gln) amidotransferase subunit C
VTDLAPRVGATAVHQTNFMTIHPDDIAKLCRLAQIALDDGERAATIADLDKMIHMIDALQSIDTDGVDPLAHPLDAAQRLRADEITEVVDRDRYQASAPAVQDGLYLVPRVL